jgi:hypothetical protein
MLGHRKVRIPWRGIVINVLQQELATFRLRTDEGLGADSRLAILHKDAMRDDEIIFAVEAFRFDAGPVTAERRNHGFTLIHVATATPIARLRPVKGHDGLFDILYWSLWKERWVCFGPFGRTVTTLDQALRIVAEASIFWVFR